MKKPVHISDHEKWQAVECCDNGYDGLFIYGVKTTGIFCRPSCRAKTPVRENVVFFDNWLYAIEAGFRPCKKCRPDKDFFDPDLDLVKKAKDVFHANYDKPIGLANISKHLGVSANHLLRLFKRHSGVTPKEYITKIRVAKAVDLLGQTDINIIDIAYMTGFKSLSNFYKSFKAQTGCAPSEYRKNRGDL